MGEIKHGIGSRKSKRVEYVTASSRDVRNSDELLRNVVVAFTKSLFERPGSGGKWSRYNVR